MIFFYMSYNERPELQIDSLWESNFSRKQTFSLAENLERFRNMGRLEIECFHPSQSVMETSTIKGQGDDDN